MTREEKRTLLAETFRRLADHAQWHYAQGRIETAPFPDALVPCAQPWACPGRV